jgi:prevent-host-death family protein
MKTITVEELQKDFEEILAQVEQGHQFIVESKKGDVLLMPYKIYDYNEPSNLDDDLTRIHTDHEEGC